MKQKSELVERYNDRLSKVYDEATRVSDKSWTSPKVVDGLVLPYVKEGTKVLDLGTGTGQAAEPLFRAGAQVTGVDVSADMIAVTAEKFPTWHLEKWDLGNGLPDFEGTFDVVIASGVLEFVEDLEKLISSVASVLYRSGIFCFSFEEYLPDHPLQKEKESTLGSGILESVPEELSFLVYRRSLAEVDRVLSKSGFKIKKTKQFTSYYRGADHVPVIYGAVLAQKV